MAFTNKCPPNYKNGYELMMAVCKLFGAEKPNCFMVVSISNEPHICFLKYAATKKEQAEIEKLGCYWSAKYEAICISQETLLKYE